FSSRRRHTISKRDWSSDVCSSDLSFSLSLKTSELSSSSYHHYHHPFQFIIIIILVFRHYDAFSMPIGHLWSLFFFLQITFETKEIGRSSCRDRLLSRSGVVWVTRH